MELCNEIQFFKNITVFLSNQEKGTSKSTIPARKLSNQSWYVLVWDKIQDISLLKFDITLIKPNSLLLFLWNVKFNLTSSFGLII